MEHIYHISVTFPDGHTDELKNTFHTLQDAIDFGNRFLVEIEATESYHHHDDSDEDFLPLKKKRKAHFYVKKYEGDEVKIVYDSKK